MNWSIMIPALVIIGSAYRLMLNIVQYRSAGNPIPVNVSDVYDAETYQNWRRYSAEGSRLSIVDTVISLIAELALLCTGAYAAFASLFPAGIYWQLIAVILPYTVVMSVINVGISYVSSMVIEEKYGFNRTTMKTFVTDQIRNFLLSLLIDGGLVVALAGIHLALGDWLVILFTGLIFGCTLLISFLYPIFSRIGNKFVPLEDGELKDRLMELLTKHGYQVKAIEVMDASRRTTKLNAYFTGFGR